MKQSNNITAEHNSIVSFMNIHLAARGFLVNCLKFIAIWLWAEQKVNARGNGD